MTSQQCINRAVAVHRAAAAHLVSSHQALVQPLLNGDASRTVTAAASSLNAAYVKLATVTAGHITDLERLLALHAVDDSLFARAREILTHRLARHIEWATQVEAGADLSSPDGLLPPPSLSLTLEPLQLQELLGVTLGDSPTLGLAVPANPNPTVESARQLIDGLPLPVQDAADHLIQTLDEEEIIHRRHQMLAALVDVLALDPLGVCPLPGLHSDAILPLVMMW